MSTSWQGTDGSLGPRIPQSIVVREYIADRTLEQAADLAIEPLDPPELPPLPTDATLAEQFTSMAWTIAKLTTLHRTVRPELMSTPNTLLTAEAAALGSADTTPDNLYMIGVFALEEEEGLVLDIEPPFISLLEHHAGKHLARVHRPQASAQPSDSRHGDRCWRLAAGGGGQS